LRQKEVEEGSALEVISSPARVANRGGSSITSSLALISHHHGKPRVPRARVRGGGRGGGGGGGGVGA